MTQTPTQYGYKAEHSTVTVLHTLNNTSQRGSIKWLPCAYIIVALDMSKAFDTVNNQHTYTNWKAATDQHP